MVQERQYRGIGLAQLVHKSRLKAISKLIDELKVPKYGNFADFRCAGGFIISLFQKKDFLKHYTFYGFDNNNNNLSYAKKKKD